MVSSVLSVLLLGMVPLWSHPDASAVFPAALSVAAPSTLAFPEGLGEELSASGMLIVDLRSGQQIASHRPSMQLPIASLTKLMTALIIVEHHDLRERLEIPLDITETDGTLAKLSPGEHFTVGDVLSALLIASGNDAAEALARFHSGSVDAFAEQMNMRAKELGLRQTSFVNASGLDAPGQVSTAREIGWLASFVLGRPEIRSRMERRGVTIESSEGTEVSLVHTHALLHTNHAIVAGKTGTTESAGQCLLSVVAQEGRQYLVILLRSGDRYGDMRRILTVFDELSATP